MAAARADARLSLLLPEGKVLSEREALAVEDEVRESLERVCSVRTKFLDSGAVYDRKEIKEALQSLLKRKGQLALLLGGKSVGKTLLLQDLTGHHKDIVGEDGARRALLYVDARSCGGDLEAGLVAALQKEAREQARLEGQGHTARLRQAKQPGTPVTPSSLPSAKSVKSISFELKYKDVGVGSQLELFKGGSEAKQSIALLSEVAEVAQAQGYYLCLIIDEANLIFPAPSDPLNGLLNPPLTPEQVKAKQLLEKLVELTKQGRRMNVLLVSSEYAYPYRLRHGGFFNISNLSRTLFAGEVPPADMRSLLQDKWGLGPQLSDVFLAYYGGHVYMASEALSSLQENLDNFNCLLAAPQGLLSDISICITASDSAMAATLSAVAQHGFVPVKDAGDVSAQKISQASIGGLVNTSDIVVGPPKSLLKDTHFGLVPSSQFAVSTLPYSYHQFRPSKLTHPSHFPTPLSVI